MVPTPDGALDVINSMFADPLFQIVARLAKGPSDSQDTPLILSTMVEADFPGYAPIVLTPDLAAAIDEGGYGELSPQRLHWEAGTIVTPQRITHVYYTKTYNGGGASLVGGTAFDNPIVIYAAGQAIEFDAVIAGVQHAT